MIIEKISASSPIYTQLSRKGSNETLIFDTSAKMQNESVEDKLNKVYNALPLTVQGMIDEIGDTIHAYSDNPEGSAVLLGISMLIICAAKRYGVPPELSAKAIGGMILAKSTIQAGIHGYELSKYEENSEEYNTIKKKIGGDIFEGLTALLPAFLANKARIFVDKLTGLNTDLTAIKSFFASIGESANMDDIYDIVDLMKVR